MIYLVTNQQELFDNEVYSIIDTKKCLNLLLDMPIIQVDTETNGKDAHVNQLLCIQFGSDKLDARIVVDLSTIDILIFKEVLESKYLIFQNGKFDLQFLYNYNIHPLKVYDTMIVEQFLHLGYPAGSISYSLKEIAYRRLGVDLDKTIRSQIIWRGLDSEVIKYAAGDVTYLEKIMKSQLEDIKKIPNSTVGAKIECDFTPVIAYLEWCGIKLDEDKWKEKMKKDKEHLEASVKALNDFVINNNILKKKFTHTDLQGNLFTGYDTTPKVDLNWSSSQQVVKVAKELGFNTVVQDKKTGEDKDSVLEKTLKCQKGIDDKFLELYFNYQEYAKVVSSFGQGHLDAVNPITGRIHTIFRAIGAASGRMSCGSNQTNNDLAKVKHLPTKDCKYVNLQQLPADEGTRSSFVAEENNLMVDCDFGALESRLGADIYQEKTMIEEFLHGSGDMHSLCAKMVFHKELEGIDVKDVKKKRPDLRKKVKPIEFSQQFGGSEYAIQGSLGCSIEEARVFKEAYDKGFSGITIFKNQGSKFVRSHGYVELCKATGHRMYWHDWKEWKARQSSFTPEFWDDYKLHHKGTGDSICQEVKMHFQAASKWDRMALNGPTQGTGCIILKTAATNLYKWIIDNNLFGKIKLCALVHDEILAEYPKELNDFPKILEDIMEKAAAKFCKSLPIPAEAEVGTCWKH